MKSRRLPSLAVFILAKTTEKVRAVVSKKPSQRRACWPQTSGVLDLDSLKHREKESQEPGENFKEPRAR